jgi:hypothetical protein
MDGIALVRRRKRTIEIRSRRRIIFIILVNRRMSFG